MSDWQAACLHARLHVCLPGCMSVCRIIACLLTMIVRLTSSLHANQNSQDIRLMDNDQHA
jgi:hypothetical protein